MKKLHPMGTASTKPTAISISQGQGRLADESHPGAGKSPGPMKGTGSGKGSGKSHNMGQKMSEGTIDNQRPARHANAQGQTAGRRGVSRPFGVKSTKP